MKFDIITIFPDIFSSKSGSYLNESILKRGQEKKLISVEVYDLRDFAIDKYKKVDDKPYGGGPGMVFKAEPIIKAISSILNTKIKNKNSKIKTRTKIILFSPAGKQFDNKMAGQLAKNYDNLILICGRYEGVDGRVKKVIKDLKLEVGELSVGPYVLTGGELPAMVLVDAVARQISGVLGKEESLEDNRFGVGLPVYTRPETFIHKKKKYSAPKILLSGDHKKITAWRKKAQEKTA